MINHPVRYRTIVISLMLSDLVMAISQAYKAELVSLRDYSLAINILQLVILRTGVMFALTALAVVALNKIRQARKVYGTHPTT